MQNQGRLVKRSQERMQVNTSLQRIVKRSWTCCSFYVMVDRENRSEQLM